MNFQIQFTRHQHAVPITRDYMFEAEKALRIKDRRIEERESLKIAGE
jgi:cyclopropane-fatty-acyl-phospholipid synthase